ncbi:hypothetical protein ACVWYG_002259 [Pedobacter sp. UYEF25]
MGLTIFFRNQYRLGLKNAHLVPYSYQNYTQIKKAAIPKGGDLKFFLFLEV